MFGTIEVMMSTQNIIEFLSLITLIGQVVVVVLAALLLWERGRKKQLAMTKWVSRHGIVLMLIVALIATVGSLYLSEIAGFTPCKNCWLQRIFTYPQVVLLIVALWMRDRSVVRYILALSLIGICFSSYHYFLQIQKVLTPIVVDPSVPCDASGASCASTPFLHFGYITIPLMAWTAFALNSVISIVVLRKDRKTR